MGYDSRPERPPLTRGQARLRLALYSSLLSSWAATVWACYRYETSGALAGRVVAAVALSVVFAIAAVVALLCLAVVALVVCFAGPALLGGLFNLVKTAVNGPQTLPQSAQRSSVFGGTVLPLQTSEEAPALEAEDEDEPLAIEAGPLSRPSALSDHA